MNKGGCFGHFGVSKNFTPPPLPSIKPPNFHLGFFQFCKITHQVMFHFKGFQNRKILGQPCSKMKSVKCTQLSNLASRYFEKKLLS